MTIVILVFSFVIFLATLWYGVKMIRLYLRVRKWEKANAVITNKSVVERKRASASRAGYKPHIEYKYNYNSKPFIGNKIFLVELINGERGFARGAAEKFNEKLSAETQVYINPLKPEEAVMFCDGLGLYILMIILGITSLLIGLLQCTG